MIIAINMIYDTLISKPQFNKTQVIVKKNRYVETEFYIYYNKFQNYHPTAHLVLKELLMNC